MKRTISLLLIICLSLCSCGSYKIENNNYSVPYLDGTTTKNPFSVSSPIETGKSDSTKTVKDKCKTNTRTKIGKKETKVVDAKNRLSKKSAIKGAGNKNNTNGKGENNRVGIGSGNVSGQKVDKNNGENVGVNSGGSYEKNPEQTLATTEVLTTEATTLAPLKDTDTAYITKYGKKYHRADCGYLYKSKIAILVGEAKEKGYVPCSVCNP